MLAGSALVWQGQSQTAVPLSAPLASVLANVDGFIWREQPIEAEEQRVAGMTNYVARRYMRDDAVAFTTLVSYYDQQTRGKTIHSPRNCLPGAGWEIVRRGTQAVSVGSTAYSINRYVLKNGPHVAIVYYWYQGRGRVTANEYVVKWNLLRDAAILGRTEEALVRVVVPVSAASIPRIDSGMLVAEDALSSGIASQLIRDVSRVMPAPGG